MLKFASCSLLASMALLTVGCATQAPKSNPAVKPAAAPVGAREAGAIGAPQPDGVDLSRESGETIAEALAAAWVREALDVPAFFERGMRLYPDLREQYQLRTRSGFTAERAQAEVLPLLRERVTSAPRLEGRPYFMPLAAQSGPLGGSFNFFPTDQLVRLDKGMLAAAWGANMPLRFSATKHKPVGGGAPGVIGFVNGTVEFAASSQFNGKSTLDRVVYSAVATSDVTLPVSAEQLLNLRQKSPSGSVFAHWSGGYLRFGAEGVRCDESYDRSRSHELHCRFKVSGQAMAPIALMTTPPGRR